MADIRGRGVIVTGGGKNLGGAVARRLGEAGARVVVHFNSDGSRLAAEETASAVSAAGGEGRALQADLSDSAGVDHLFTEAIDFLGELYGTVNTVGRAAGEVVTQMSEDELDKMIAINVKATFLVLQAAARHTVEGGRIVNLVTSLLAAFTPGYSIYAGTKATNEHFVRALAKELANRQISVNNVAPGPMDTPFYWDAAHEGETETVSGMAMGNRLTKVDDIVPWIYLLLTDGGWASGQTIFLNGGFATR